MPPIPETKGASGGAPEFTTTLWSVVRLAGGNDDTQSFQALEGLCRRYWYPLYAYARRKGNAPDAAQDLTQGFFAYLLSHRLLTKADKARGKFRSFLLKSFTRYMSDEWDRARAAKRGGGAALISLDAQDAEARYRLEPADQSDPEKIFERRWAVTLVETTLKKLELEFERSGKSKLFAEMRFVFLGETSETTRAALASRLGLEPSAVRVALHRLRQRYRELFRDEVAQTVCSEDELEEELQYIFRILSQ